MSEIMNVDAVVVMSTIDGTTEKLVYATMKFLSSDEEHVTTSHSALAKILGLSPRTIARSIQALRTSEIIKSLQINADENGRMCSTTYSIK